MYRDCMICVFYESVSRAVCFPSCPVSRSACLRIPCFAAAFRIGVCCFVRARGDLRASCVVGVLRVRRVLTEDALVCDVVALRGRRDSVVGVPRRAVFPCFASLRGRRGVVGVTSAGAFVVAIFASRLRVASCIASCCRVLLCCAFRCLGVRGL